ncbi:MAG: monovalent cation/H+ antiporter subunit D [Gammaproteobacteria bacterium]|nr:monovalent cation/H+ antiporter subunit D [Gammaproteobacteria bacterium]MBU0770580.1 monovalent cation/H+ antiporter subunit D [Gammaproteobacteria bacterium]MBU0857655.1 monovalent cation/H+ antiporter subunit D [Gammaproteobacteria bacterium]MBU1845171.1 monovalent cation/H+ antiporter subunit D [Gammaproteobacteria bacterium]
MNSGFVELLMRVIQPHLAVLPVLLPAFTAMVLLLVGDRNESLRLRRRIALASAAIGGLIVLKLALDANADVLRVYRVGDWPAPFGIVLVVDRLSALMLLLTQAIALPVLLYASGGWDSHGRHFHALFQFQLMGLNGAFVTGDLFNLFVFFEILLIASYVLLAHGQGRERFRVGVQYVAINLAASALFLIGVALIYATVGTLNMADLAQRVPRVTGDDAVVLKAAALILLVVFGVKAALLPLCLWLPATYAAASAPVAALFAIMTKVGVYSIVRVHGVIFGDAAGAAALVVEPWLLPLALATGVFAVFGVLAANTLPRLVAYLTVASVGTILAAIGLFTTLAWSAAFYYMAHSTLVIAALFLLVELVAAQRGDAADRLEPGAPVAQPVLLGLMLLLAAASSAGLPPLPGFIGKLMVLQASSGHAAQAWIWTVVLSVGFLTLIGLARAGSLLFWSVRPELAGTGNAAGASPRLLAATLSLLAAGVAMSVLAGPLKRYTDAAAEQLADRDAYARAVLGGEGVRTTQPYVFPRPATDSDEGGH